MSRILIRLASVLLLVALLLPALPAVPTSAADGDPYVLELVNIQADGALNTGALYWPKGPERRATGVIVIHGTGGNFYGGVPAFLAPALAERGYVSLAYNLRNRDHLYNQSIFEDTVKDIDAAISYLQELGVEQVFLAAHSLGTHSAVYYQAITQDPRVVALGLYGAHNDLSAATNGMLMSHELYESFLAEARAHVAAGNGDYIMFQPWRPGRSLITSAKTFISYRAPESNTKAVQYIRDVYTPILIVNGVDDIVDGTAGYVYIGEWAADLKANAINSPRTDWVVTLGDHGFAGYEIEPVTATADWLVRVGLDGWTENTMPPTKPYTTQLVDIPTEDGVTLKGALYLPVRNAKRLAVLLTHGTGGNFYSSAPTSVGKELASLGYPVLAFNRRDHDGAYYTSVLEDGPKDIKAAIDFVERLGYRQVAVGGHSLGTLFIPYYQDETNDPRVAALLMMGALADLPSRTQEFVSPEDYAWLTEESRRAVEEGEPLRMFRMQFYTGAIEPTAARTFLSYRVAPGNNAPVEKIQKLTTPILLIRSAADVPAREDFSLAIAANATQSKKVDYIAVPHDVAPGDTVSGHGFVGIEQETARAIHGWLSSIR